MAIVAIVAIVLRAFLGSLVTDERDEPVERPVHFLEGILEMRATIVSACGAETADGDVEVGEGVVPRAFLRDSLRGHWIGIDLGGGFFERGDRAARIGLALVAWLGVPSGRHQVVERGDSSGEIVLALFVVRLGFGGGDGRGRVDGGSWGRLRGGWLAGATRCQGDGHDRG